MLGGFFLGTLEVFLQALLPGSLLPYAQAASLLIVVGDPVRATPRAVRAKRRGDMRRPIPANRLRPALLGSVADLARC